MLINDGDKHEFNQHKTEGKNLKNPKEYGCKPAVVKVSGVPLLLVLLASALKAQAAVFDVRKYGAKADAKTDISQAFTSAWKEACASTTPSQVLIPKRTFLLGKLGLSGPCKSAIELRVKGTLRAPADPSGLGDGWITLNYIDRFTLTGGGTFDGQGKTAWSQNNCGKDPKCKALAVNLRFNFVTNAIVKNVTILDSKNFHVNVLGCKNLTFQHLTITAPAESINTDGIHIGHSDGIYILDSNIGTGDDCISMGDGCKQLHITGVTCGPGHGISVGSLGKFPNEDPLSGIFVKNCTLSNTDNGVRIKTWPALHGGSVSDVHFEDVIVNNVSNPVVIDQMYCPWNQCNLKAPSKVKLSNIFFKKIRGTSATPVAVKILCSSGVPCEGVELGEIDIKYNGKEGPAKSVCSNVKLKITGKLIPAGC